MTRNRLEWSDVRPTLLRAVGRSGVEYRIEQSTGGRWALYRFASGADSGTRVSDGWLADMKALAELAEADAAGPPPAAQRIVWTRPSSGCVVGVAPAGRAYRIRRVTPDDWTLEHLAHDGAKSGTPLDQGPLAAMKRRAEQDATEAARESALEAADG